MEKRSIEPKALNTMRLVKSEDLNHHGTLFAGRSAEWFVESGFVAAASLVGPQSVVCLQIHGLYFSQPARPGDILTFSSKIVYAGRSSLVSYIDVVKVNETEPFVSGFITFINVDESTKPVAHNIEIVPVTDTDKLLYERAKSLKK